MFKSLTLKSIFSTFKQLSFANPNILLVLKFIYFNKNKVSTFKSTMKLTINQIGFHPIFFCLFVLNFLYLEGEDLFEIEARLETIEYSGADFKFHLKLVI